MTGDVPSAELAQDEQDPTALALTPPDLGLEDGLVHAAVPQQGWFGFTLRELIIAGAWIVAFALSFVPGAGSVLDGSATVWTMNGAWVLAIGVPTVAVFLIVLRRLSPEGIRRVGSLGVDQFASVAFTVALVSGAVLLWQQLDLVAATRRSPLVTWPLWVETLLMLTLVVVTVFAPLIPGIRDDFEDRTETLAHRSANPVRPVHTRPRPVPARGSVSDPQNDDDVDPGLRHEDEVSAVEHLSATGVTGAVVQGTPGYVPERHRGSFLATTQGEDGARATGEAPSDALVATSPVGHEEAEPSADALTEAIVDGVRAEPIEVETPADPSDTSGRAGDPLAGDTGAASDRGADPDDEQGSTGEEERGSAGEEEHGSADAVDGDAPDAGAPDAEVAPPAHSDTMTEVLGELLAPSVEDETATRAIDASPEDDRDADAEASTALREQPQPFWALAPEQRAVHDARGDEIFTIGPEAWILVLEDRGGAFVVRHDDGRVGYLHDTENMTRG